MEDVRFPLYCPLSLLWGYRSVRCRPPLCQLTPVALPILLWRILPDHISACYNHYEKLHLKFDAIYSGFLSSPKQVDCCLEFLHGNPDSLKVVDPVMGDNGKPYSTYTPELIRRMKELVDAADVITPNLTETCMLLGEECPPVMSVAQPLVACPPQRQARNSSNKGSSFDRR